MGLRTEFISTNIVENLYPDDKWVANCVDESRYVMGVLVERPVAGAEPVVVENRVSLPAPVNQRLDTTAYYLIKEWTSNPDILTNADLKELNYNKKASLLFNHAKAISKKSALGLLHAWLSASGNYNAALTTQRTTGANTTAHVGTGTRKLFTEDDLQKARTLFNKQDISVNNRYALIDADMQDQLYNDLKTKYNEVYARDVIDGNVSNLHGFKLLFRSSLLRFTNAGTPVVKLPDSSSANDDNSGVICWQADCVAKAMGSLEVYSPPSATGMYGAQTFEALLRMGGQKMRPDAKGILAIVQSA